MNKIPKWVLWACLAIMTLAAAACSWRAHELAKKLVAAFLCMVLAVASLAQSVPPPGVQAAIPVPHDTEVASHQATGAVLLVVCACVAGGFVIYAFWTPSPRWKTLVLIEHSNITGTDERIQTNTVFQSGKQMPYAFTVLIQDRPNHEFCTYRTITIEEGN